MAQTSLQVLVYGATGTQSGPVAQQLLARGHQAHVLTRSPDKAAALAAAGAHIVTGDLADPDSLYRASQGKDAVALLIPFFINPADAPTFARNAIDAARAAGVRRIVWNSSGFIPPHDTGNPGIDVRRFVVDYLRQAGVPHTIVMPGVYSENLLGPWTAPHVLARQELTYPLPQSLRVGWLPAQDVGALLVAALEQPTATGKMYAVSGAEAVTGDELAARFTQALGRDIRYVTMRPEAFGAVLDEVFGPGAGAGAAVEYRRMQEHPEQQPPMFVDMQPVLAELPVTLTPLVDWVRQQRHAFGG
ncbi:MAG: NmrA family NAD(P)-binding protein [Anaerolineae bacterium]|nr:NmrA family NAD(P)-binding protein [Anaerolineae bacterium]